GDKMKFKSALRVLALSLFTLAAFSAARAQVTGSGTPNKLPKWTGVTTIGDSGITENASGNVSIGTSPVSTIKVLMQPALTGRGVTLRAVNTSSGRAIEGSSSSGIGVNAFSGSGNALTANSTSGIGVSAISQTGVAINANSASNDGVYGVSNS